MSHDTVVTVTLLLVGVSSWLACTAGVGRSPTIGCEITMPSGGSGDVDQLATVGASTWYRSMTSVSQLTGSRPAMSDVVASSNTRAWWRRSTPASVARNSERIERWCISAS